VQQLIHHGALATAAHPGDAHQAPQGKVDVETGEVVALTAHQGELAGTAAAAFRRCGDGAAAAQIGAGEGVVGRQQGVEAALRHDVAAVHAGTGADVHNVVGGANRVLVVLHHDQGVAQIPQLGEGVEEAIVVALVQADARLIQHVEDTGEAGTDLGGQPDALGFTAGEGHGRAVEAQSLGRDGERGRWQPTTHW